MQPRDLACLTAPPRAVPFEAQPLYSERMIQPRTIAVLSVAALSVALVSSVLSGCAGADAGIPSLAPRPIERLTTAEPVSPATAMTPADPALAARYDAIIADAEAGDAAFRTALAVVGPTAARARGSAAGSDAWIEAQQSLTRLETARAPVTAALAALDAERTSGVFDKAPLDAAIARTDALDASERIAVDGIAAMLAGG